MEVYLSINLINGGDGYDVINPPKILVETGLGNKHM